MASVILHSVRGAFTWLVSCFLWTQLQKVLPRSHPDVDDLFLNHVELPGWHPDMSLALNDNPIEPVYVFRCVMTL